MRYFIIILLCCFTLTIPASAQSDADTLRAANAAYENGDYPLAILLYETVITAGARDGVVYFNLGNSYYQSGDSGRALLNYRRAQNIMPRDLDLNINIARIRSERTDIQGDETALPDSLSALTSNTLTITEFGWLMLVLWALWFVILLVRILRPRWRSTLIVPLLAFGITLIIGIALFGSRLYVENYRPAAVVVAPITQVMSGPGDNYLGHFQIHIATELRILETRGEWTRFVLPDGRQGWILDETIEKI